MRPTSIGPALPGDAGWKQWVSDALRQIDAYSQQPYITLIGDVTSPVGGAQIPTTIAGAFGKRLNSLPATGTSVSDTTSISTAFDNYEVVFENVIPVTNAVTFEMLVHSGGSFQATSYVNSAGGNTTFIDLSQGTVGNTAGLGFSGQITIFNVNSATMNKIARGSVAYYTGAALASIGPAGFWNGGLGAIDGLQFKFSSGNIASGTIKIYGVP